MQVTFQPNYRPSFKANALRNESEVVNYITKLAKTRDVLDLQETIKLTAQTGKKTLVDALRMGAEDLKIKLS